MNILKSYLKNIQHEGFFDSKEEKEFKKKLNNLLNDINNELLNLKNCSSKALNYLLNDITNDINKHYNKNIQVDDLYNNKRKELFKLFKPIYIKHWNKRIIMLNKQIPNMKKYAKQLLVYCINLNKLINENPNKKKGFMNNNMIKRFIQMIEPLKKFIKINNKIIIEFFLQTNFYSGKSNTEHDNTNKFIENIIDKNSLMHMLEN